MLSVSAVGIAAVLGLPSLSVGDSGAVELPDTSQIEQIVKSEEHAISTHCRRLENVRKVLRWNCGVITEEGRSTLSVRVHKEGETIVVKGRATGDIPSFVIVQTPSH